MPAAPKSRDDLAARATLPSGDPLSRAVAIGPAIRAAADEIERTRRIPETLATELHASGLLRLFLAKPYGGGEVHPGAYLSTVIEVARHDASIGWNMFVANSSALIAPHIPPETAVEIFSDPRALIAWGPPNACRARSVPGGYRVDGGRWDFASGCRQATWMGVHAHVEEPDGSLRLNAAGRPTIRSLLFPVRDAQLLDTWNPIGLRGTASDSYTVDNLFVPEARSGTRETPAGRNIPGKLFAFTMQGLYAVGVAGVALGIAREMLAEFVRLAAEKVPRGQSRLADQGLVQAGVARAEAKLAAAEAYLQTSLADIYSRADDWGVIGTEDRVTVRLTCANAIHGSTEVAGTIYKLAGVSAIFPGSPFERRFRDIHTLSQQIQSRTSHFEAVGRMLLGADDPAFL